MKATATFALILSFVSTCLHSQIVHRGSIMIDSFQPLHRFVPEETVGAAFDGHPAGEIDRILTRRNIAAMKEIGFGPLAYRLRTELAAEAWHWNPVGKWSDEEHKQGYWVSDSLAEKPIHRSYGYRLPRRGNTHDQANDDFYSMIDDGDTTTFWKSNPYLTGHFTNEPDSLHPQWIVIDFGKTVHLNAVHILWGRPFALECVIDYATDIGSDYFDPFQPGLWHALKTGKVDGLTGDDKMMRIADQPVALRFIRISMWRSSYNGIAGSRDVRDQLGFAIREIEAGTIDQGGRFHDLVKHSKSNTRQTVIHASSTDPWHRAVDLDSNCEQAGIDRFFECGIATGKVLLPVGLLYDTPDNMASLLAHVHEKRMPVLGYELGEEPEGQLIDPRDYAALYLQWASIFKNRYTGLSFGGPGFAALATTGEDQYSFTEQTWTRIFLRWLQERHSMNLFDFFSFEWYPFDDVCAPTAPQLAANPAMIAHALYALRREILPRGMPVYVTEYGYSAHSGRAEVDIEGALMYADILGSLLNEQVTTTFLYGYEPTYLDEYNGCSWGNNMLFAMGDDSTISYHTAAYYGMKMLTQHWMYPRSEVMTVFAAHNSDSLALRGLVTYALMDNDGRWRLAVINKSPHIKVEADVRISNGSQSHGVAGTFSCYQYSKAQYRWKAHGDNGKPALERPPATSRVAAASVIRFPPYSLTVLVSE
ncbi:MAG TPA: discoidin domain-containing protein [Chitinophagaceae bacterium]